MAGDIKVGSYEGTGAAINIQLGWVPDFIHIWNATDGDVHWDWFNGLGAGDALQNTNHASTQNSLITSNGIDPYTPTNLSAKDGFTVGTALSESGKVFRYLAVRNGEY